LFFSPKEVDKLKVLSVYGYTGSGKTSTIELIIRELVHRGYSVGSVKEIHYEQFAIDTLGSNTDRHRRAGAELVTARGINETDVLFPNRLSIEQILSFYSQDYVVLEGVRDTKVPKILCAKNREEIIKLIDETVFAISGVISNEISSYNNLPVINSLDNVKDMVDLIHKKVKDYYRYI
jgi:molybdopterin-guanine dinucleotide biosynthesis protein B